mmetsp:Transcript_10844/g.34364  ORF Transcript_10844/g.34364 Transcript_10844/m.34364 type:complete len:205 (-) Transcript_10844:295-909(-)
MPRTLRVTSLIWRRIQGIRLSVGFAFRSVSSALTTPSGRASPLLELGWSVQMTTRPVPLGSRIATILPIMGLSEFPRDHCVTFFCVRPACSSSTSVTGPWSTTSSSESEDSLCGATAGKSGPASSSSCASSSSTTSPTGATATMSPCTARLRAFFPLIRRSGSLLVVAPSGRTCAMLSLLPLALSVPRIRSPEVRPARTPSSSQ